jgi:hypothetical protein
MDAKDITRRYHPHVKGWSEVKPHVAPFFGYVAAEKVRHSFSITAAAVSLLFCSVLLLCLCLCLCCVTTPVLAPGVCTEHLLAAAPCAYVQPH